VLVVRAEDQRVRLSLTLGTKRATHVCCVAWMLLTRRTKHWPRGSSSSTEGGRQEKRVGKHRRRHARTGVHRLHKHIGRDKEHTDNISCSSSPCVLLGPICLHSAEKVHRLRPGRVLLSVCLFGHSVPHQGNANERQHDGTDTRKQCMNMLHALASAQGAWHRTGSEGSGRPCQLSQTEHTPEETRNNRTQGPRKQGNSSRQSVTWRCGLGASGLTD
jgi:hypothetical protein